MALLDVIDFDEISTVNSVWQIKFFEPLAKVGEAMVWKLWENQKEKKKFKNKKNQNYWIRWFLILCTVIMIIVSNIIIIIIIILIILIFLLFTHFLLGGKVTEPAVFQHFKAKEHSILSMYVLPLAGSDWYFNRELAEMKGEISQRIICKKWFLWELWG